MSMTFQQAVEHAAWWTRAALDLAGDDPDLHPGAVAHMKAARAQHAAAEQLVRDRMDARQSG